MSPKSPPTDMLQGKSTAADTPQAKSPADTSQGKSTRRQNSQPSAKLRASREALSQTVAAAAGLLAEGDRAHSGIAGDARDLLLDEIIPDPRQPRRHFDEAEMRALADDIARRGVLQPVLVRPPAAPGEAYRLVAGERRWRAARLAGKARIPARIRDIPDDDVQAAQLAENIMRAGLTDIEKGRALRRLYELRKIQSYKTTWEDIAAEVGLGRARINDLFSLAALPDPVASLIESNRLTGSHGILLQRAQSSLVEEDIIALAQRAARPQGKRVGGCALTVAQLRRLIHERSGQDLAPGGAAATAQRDADIALASLKPFVKRTLEAVASGRLTGDERAALIHALSAEPPDRGGSDGKAPQKAALNAKGGGT